MVDEYTSAIETMRKQKDEWLRHSPDSPISHPVRHGFAGLVYFPVDPVMRFRARLIVHPEQEVLRFPTSRGTEQAFFRHGYFEFAVGGQTVRLNAYKPVHSHEEHASLFVPFRDATSGKETYGAGRYLDLEWQASGVYDLDFNQAYNPYCAYSENYVCPLPPPENWLPVAIRAGEKTWTH